MINYYILEKEMKKIDNEVEEMKETEKSSETEKFLDIKLKSHPIVSENDDPIDEKRVKVHIRMIEKNYSDYVETVCDKIAKKLKVPGAEVSNPELIRVSHYQTEKNDSFSLTFEFKGVKCNVTVSFDENNEESATSSIVKESAVAEEYGTADLAAMLPQTPVSEPVLTKPDDLVPPASKKPVEEKTDTTMVADITNNERDMSEVSAKAVIARNDLLDDLRSDIKTESENIEAEDPYYSYILTPVFESPVNIIADIKNKVSNNRILALYWDTKLLKSAVTLHDKYKDILSESSLEMLKKKLNIRESKLKAIMDKIPMADRGKYDYSFKKIDAFMDRKFADAERFMKTKVAEASTKYNDETKQKKQFKSIDKMFGSFIRKTEHEKIHLKRYIKNLENMVESMIEIYPDSVYSHILEKCAKNLKTYSMIVENKDFSNIVVTNNSEINVKESFFDDEETIVNSFMVTLESMKEMIENLNKTGNEDVVSVLEKAYNNMLETTAEIELTTEEYTDELYDEAAEMEDEIRPIVETLNRKGYKVKYANPGHLNFRSNKDGKRDGLKYGKLYFDAHIQFDGEYGIKAPEYWNFRTTQNGDYLDVQDITYPNKVTNKKDIMEKRAAYKRDFMNSLKKWADSLPEFNGDKNSLENEPKNVKESTEFDDFFNDFL